MRATFEEGTEIKVDSEEPAYAAGWSDQAAPSDVFRNGDQVTAVLRVKNAAKSAKLITTLPQDFRPAAAVRDAQGKVEVKANGEVLSLQSLVELEAAQEITAQITYRAGLASP